MKNTAMTLFLILLVASKASVGDQHSNEFSQNEVPLLLSCVFNKGDNLLGNEYKNGSMVKVRYRVCRNCGDLRRDQIYVAVRPSNRSRGRLLLFSVVPESSIKYTLSNDADFSAKNWHLLSDPQGGNGSEAAMLDELRRLRLQKDLLLTLRSSDAPRSCDTYLSPRRERSH